MNSIPRSYRERFGLPDRCYIPVLADGLDWRSLETAIVFVMARWSGASQLAFRALNTTLGALPESAAICVFIIDIDSHAAQAFFADVAEIPGEIRGGYGETYWIKRGRIIARLSNYAEPDDLHALRANTSRLLT